MKKRVIGNLAIASFVIFLALTFFQRQGKNRSIEEEIQFFILEQLEANVSYLPGEFQEINEAFLLSQKGIQTSMNRVQDSLNKQLQLIKRHMLSERLISSVTETEAELKKVSLESVPDILRLHAQLKRSMKQDKGIGETVRHQLFEEETRMNAGINDLNAALTKFNMSVFSLDFEQSESVTYYHEFELSDQERGTTKHQAIIEMHVDSREVRSFREV